MSAPLPLNSVPSGFSVLFSSPNKGRHLPRLFQTSPFAFTIRRTSSGAANRLSDFRSEPRGVMQESAPYFLPSGFPAFQLPPVPGASLKPEGARESFHNRFIYEFLVFPFTPKCSTPLSPVRGDRVATDQSHSPPRSRFVPFLSLLSSLERPALSTGLHHDRQRDLTPIHSGTPPPTASPQLPPLTSVNPNRYHHGNGGPLGPHPRLPTPKMTSASS